MDEFDECPERRNFSSVLKLMAEAEVAEQGKTSKLDLRMTFLAETSPMKDSHPAVKQYRKCMRGAGDTVRSIIISANSRLATLENPQVLRLLSKDDLNLAQIKALFKDTWETIPGNCDSLVYLGGNESSTHEYISKMLGKATIDKRSSGETRGRQFFLYRSGWEKRREWSCHG